MRIKSIKEAMGLEKGTTLYREKHACETVKVLGYNHTHGEYNMVDVESGKHLCLKPEDLVKDEITHLGKKVESFYIEYFTGAGNKVVTGSIDDAKRAAADGMRYTQQDVVICEGDHYEDDNLLISSAWNGIEATDEDDVLVTYGDFGFYSEWE